MTTQSRTWQQEIIRAAQAVGELDHLYWFVEQRDHSTAMHPRGHIPLVPVAPDAAESRRRAYWLMESLPGVGKSLALTNAEALGSLRWYIWGAPPTVDEVCAVCGGIEHVEYTGEGSWICGHCATI